MKKLLVVIALLLTAGFVFGQQPQKGDNIDPQIWQMSINLETPILKPPAVQWTVFDKDPIPDFRARVKSMKALYSEQLERAENDGEREIARSAMMRVSWDLGFKEVTGDQLYLLTKARGVSHSLASNDPDGKKWIVTKIVQIKGKLVCWCIPVTVKTGERIHIMLTKDNMFDLGSEFDKVMRED